MCAKLFRIICALKIIVGLFGKTLRMQIKSHFPTDQQRNRQYQQAPGIAFFDKKQRRKHHRIIPVVYPAGTAAFVFHEPGLEGTEKQYADDIADGIRTA